MSNQTSNAVELPENPNNIIKMNLEDKIKNDFLLYAKAIISDRALPNIQDGLKPVQKRILLSMKELNFTSNAPFRKCVKTVGQTLSEYHPHGLETISPY